MSVLLDSTNDKLSSPNTLSISKSACILAGWVKLVADNNALAAFGRLSGNPNEFLFRIRADGTTVEGKAGANTFGTYVPTIGTWYYYVLSRDADNGNGPYYVRVLDTSGTIQASLTNSAANIDLGTTCVVELGSSSAWANIEVEAFRCVVSTTWTNAQAWTEAQSYTYVLGSGTLLGNWQLKTSAANSGGINDSSGAGRNLTNSGAVDGPTHPSPLPASVLAIIPEAISFGGLGDL